LQVPARHKEAKEGSRPFSENFESSERLRAN
jgi:hypothetical protein